MTADSNNSPQDAIPSGPIDPGDQGSFSPPSERNLPSELSPQIAGKESGAMGRPSDPQRDIAWNGWDVLRILIMAVVALFLGVGLLLLVVPGSTLHARALRLNATPELLILGQMLAYTLLFGYMYILVTRERRQPRFWQALHWNWPGRIGLYILIGLALQAALLVLERFLSFPKETPFDAILRRPYSIYLLAIFSVTLGPLMEEMFFRGFLYPVLRRRIGVLAAIVATAFPFAMLHVAQYGNSWASVLLIFIVGVVLATVREKRNSLGAAFVVHAAYNGTIMMMIFLITGGFRHLERLANQ